MQGQSLWEVPFRYLFRALSDFVTANPTTFSDMYWSARKSTISFADLHKMDCSHTIHCRFQLSSVAFEALLKLVCALLPNPNRCLKSLYRLRKYCLRTFPDFKSTHHGYCMTCNAPLNDETNCLLCGGSKRGRFLVADIGMQLKEKFKGIIPLDITYIGCVM